LNLKQVSRELDTTKFGKLKDMVDRLYDDLKMYA